MSSEGIYIGLNGGVKQLANELFGVPFGVSSYILGRFLVETWKPSEKYEKEELEWAEKVVKQMTEYFNQAGHSGGSACVATQNLLSVMGCGAVSKEEIEVYFTSTKPEDRMNVWSRLENQKKRATKEKEGIL